MRISLSLMIDAPSYIIFRQQDSNEISIVLIIMMPFVITVCQIKKQGIVVKTMARPQPLASYYHSVTLSDLKPNNFIRAELSVNFFGGGNFRNFRYSEDWKPNWKSY